MPLIQLETIIYAPIQRCFDLSRSIDLHKISMAHTNEKAVSGTTEGLIELGEYVTWQAKHFGITQHLTVQITTFDRPNFFVDEMTKGIFKSFQHQHIFESTHQGTLMIDLFDFEAPIGLLGKIVNYLFLVQYMTQLLEQRNRTIKKIAESEAWKAILPH